jgi:SAM-dependent methyltransferase
VVTETGIDNREIAIEYSRKRGDLNLLLGDVNNSLFTESSFDLITCFDVLSSHGVNDNLAVKNFHSYLKNKGVLLLTLPAFQFLYSKHDQVVNTNRRYLKSQLKTLLESNGFEIIKISYCVSLLFPLALIKRIFDKLFSTNDKDHNEVRMPSKIVNQLFLYVMRSENFLMRYFSFPFGLSVMALARKK